MRCRLGVCLLLASLVACTTHAVGVDLRGAIDHPGRHDFAPGARLSDAALAAAPRPEAYLLGAAWLRADLRVAQRRLQAGILFDLSTVGQRALIGDHPALAARATALARWVKAMPVTGRAVALLDPRKVEITATENWPLAEGDALYYPRRPRTIRIVGAVERPCEVPHVALREAADYLRDCLPAKEADPDWLYVIQPDGRVFRQGVALWNRTAPQALAPGALLMVPLGVLSDIAPTLNGELADFLATQLLPAEGP